ncbi:MAG: pilus assembly protein PilM [Pirellulaceae bacterium]
MLPFFNLRRAGPIGIDLGSRSVKMVQFSANREDLIAAGRWEFPAATSPEQHAEHVAETIQRGLTERKFVGRDVVLCLGDKELVLQNIRVPKSEGAELDRHVAQEAAGRVPFAVEEAEIRYIEAADVRQGDAVLREVIVFACHRPVLQKSLDLAAKGHLNPLAVDVEPAALVRSYAAQFRRQEDFNGRALVIHIGHQRTAVVITQGIEILFVKYIDIGGAHLDTAVARHLRMEAKEAADLRRHSGDRRTDLQDPEVMRSVSEATRGVIERLGSELALCIRYHSVTFRGQPLSRVVLGGGEATQQLADVLGKMLNLKCELSDPFRALSLQRDVGRRGLWDVAAGLALKEVK